MLPRSLLALFISLLALAACGSSATMPVAASATSALASPDSLLVTYINPAQPAQHWTVTDPGKILGLEQQMLALPTIDPLHSPACLATTRQYTFVFMRQGTEVLHASVVQCANLLHLSDNTTRIISGTFWQQVNAAVGTSIAPM